MPTSPRVRSLCLASCLLATLGAAANAQTPPETFGEEVVVRETSIAALPPGDGSDVPGVADVTVTVDGLAQRVTRVEPVLEARRGDWQFVVYLDPRLAGARTRYLAALALAQRAESLVAMGTTEVLVAGSARPVLARTDSWQRVEAALLSHALEARHRLNRGDVALERPDWALFGDRLDLLLETLRDRGSAGPRALFLPSDGLYSAAEADELDRLARLLAGNGWVLVPMPWSEAPDEVSAARLSEFESWKQSAEGRDGSVGTQRYVIDLGRVVRRLSGGAPPSVERDKIEPHLVALSRLADPTSGLLAGGEGELRAALSNLARRWRVWFQTAETDAARPLPVEVRLGDQRLKAPRWILSPPVE